MHAWAFQFNFFLRQLKFMEMIMNSFLPFVTGTYIRWYFRTYCTSVKANRSFLKLNIEFEAVVNVNNCLKQIKIPNLGHMYIVHTVF